MLKHEEAISVIENGEARAWLEMLAWDGPRDPESVATLKEHETDRQAFLDAKVRLIEQYNRAGGQISRSFEKHVPWESLADWAFNPKTALRRDLYETAVLNPEDMQAILEISDLALTVLVTHRSLIETFSQLSAADKGSLRPQKMHVSWQPYSNNHWSEVEVDVSGLILGDATDRYLRWQTAREDILYEDRHLYSDEIQHLLQLRSEYLTQPQILFVQTWGFTGNEERRKRRLYQCDIEFRKLCGGARDNGDKNFWEAASRHLDPCILDFRKVHGLQESQRQEEPKPRLYISDHLHPGERPSDQ